MAVKKFNISKPKKYIDKTTGEEKTFWQNIGTLTEFQKPDGSISRIIEIPAISLEANVFPIEPRPPQGGYAPAPTGGTAPPARKVAVDPALAPEPIGTEEINIKDIPF